MARFEKLSRDFVEPRWPFPRSRKLWKSHESVSSILGRARSRTDRDRGAERMAASKISWFNFPSVATRNSSVRDSLTRMADGQTWNARNYAPLLLSLSLFVPTRWKMFYDQTLGSPFKQHIANPTAESSNDRTWQNIVAKPSSCIYFSHHFCLWNWFIAIVVWKLGRAKCFPTFAAKPWRTKLGIVVILCKKNFDRFLAFTR